VSAHPARDASRDAAADPDGLDRRCPACQSRALRPRQTYCSPACRQLAFRRRRAVPPPAPIRLPTHVVVYQCPACEQRYRGEQRCPSCNLFCRRLGAGDACPHCGEPVAVSDLVP
jgi:hypothetical protein